MKNALRIVCKAAVTPLVVVYFAFMLVAANIAIFVDWLNDKEGYNAQINKEIRQDLKNEVKQWFTRF